MRVWPILARPLIAIDAPMMNVDRPIALNAIERKRSWMALPKSRPATVPARIVATLTMTPVT